MKCELTKKSFEVPVLLERHNDLEQAICRTVFQDKYSSSVKTYHVIDHLVARGEELGLMGAPSYLAAIEALKRFSSYHAGLIRGFAGERRGFYAIKHVESGFEQLVNAELDYEGEHDEFDQILVSRQGLVIVEVKNYSSSAAIGSDGILRFEDGSGRMRNVGERMESKRYVLRKVASDAIGRELPDAGIVSLVVNANEKASIRNDSDRVEVQSTGSIARRVEELLRGDEVLGAEDVSAIKAALEAAHHPIEIEPEIDFEYVSATRGPLADRQIGCRGGRRRGFRSRVRSRERDLLGSSGAEAVSCARLGCSGSSFRPCGRIRARINGEMEVSR